MVKVAAAFLTIAILAGLLVDVPDPAPPLRMGDYTVLTGDFHLHMFPLDGATLSPWDVVVESRRRGLHVIALTGHNQSRALPLISRQALDWLPVLFAALRAAWTAMRTLNEYEIRVPGRIAVQTWTAKIGRWFAGRTGGRPLVLVGQETITPPFDLIGVGLTHDVEWRGTAADVVRRIHEQGGVAIAAHPLRSLWPAFDAAAMAELDGAEVLHPMRFVAPHYGTELDEFFARRPMAAIGSSDFHATGFPGFSRTYVFVRDVTEAAVLDALREHRTVGVDEDASYIGNPELVALAKANGGLAPSAQVPDTDVWGLISRYAALAAMGLACVFGFRRRELS